MKKYENNLRLFYQATQIPFCLFNNTPSELLYFPCIESLHYSVQILKQCRNALFKNNEVSHFPLLYSSDTCFLVLLKLDENLNIIFGPVSTMSVSYKDFYNSNNFGCDLNDLLHLYRITQQSPYMSMSQFANCIALYLKLEFQQEINTDDILKNHVIALQKNPSVENKYPFESQYTTLKTAMDFQKKVMYYLKNGNKTELEHIFANSSLFISLKEVTSSSTDYQKYFFMYAILCYITALDEGVDIHDAFPILDTYISKTPSIATSGSLHELCKQITLVYCNRIITLHNTTSTSPLVTKCLRYINRHLYSKITIDDLVQHCNVSRRTLTRHFSDYNNTTISDYIVQTKLKEAAFLLTHSQFTLSEISNQLAFSSQSHFSVAFKKYYSCTPNQYRSKNKIAL